MPVWRAVWGVVGVVSIGLSSMWIAPVLAEPVAVTPTFDCKKAQGEVENLICQQADLATLDQQMATVYAEAMKRLPKDDLATQKAMQRGWIKGRNECWKANDVKACTQSAYKTRIVELQVMSGQLDVPAPVTLRCVKTDAANASDTSQPMTAVFYNQTDPASLVLTSVDSQWLLLGTRTGSGIRYVGQNVMYEEHQGNVTISVFDEVMQCQVMQ
ncbi:lysozyme inhibitor LprI family protein [Photobacterium japonica]|uniref:lysozyme inhibitor LprI family protein n=1 Tax=Photobacterium japonica TaxID=2910235 RepID=UPI003D0E896F